MTYHVIIQKELRSDPARQALFVAGQLHTQGASIADLTNPNLLYVAEWDGKAPFVTVTKGNIADLKMTYLGWPMVDQAMWTVANTPPTS